MDLNKKPSVIRQLKSIIQNQKHQFLLLRDLEKEVGFVGKWNSIATIEKYPTIFHVSSGNSRIPPAVTLTAKAEKVASKETEARKEMEPILVNNMKKLLMLSVDCRIRMDKIECIEAALGLPPDYKKSLIPRYPEFFAVKNINGKDYLQLENWDSSLAVTAREDKLAANGVSDIKQRSVTAKMAKDGNISGPFAFKLNYPVGFRPNVSYLEEVIRWQKMDFPSPYLNARRFDVADPKARKRVVAVLHEVLSLTMEKRMTSAQLEVFHSELMLPSRLLLCLIKHHGIFYITNKGSKSTVFLKEAYEGSRLIDKCPLLKFYDEFMALTGRTDADLSKTGSSQFLG
uniref:PORR domain-containing protein n=1 Tax=Kalanchoe fedtschenkoi TaxID=63787 RepID=A0A7N0RJS8_KALFE